MSFFFHAKVKTVFLVIIQKSGDANKLRGRKKKRIETFDGKNVASEERIRKIIEGWKRKDWNSRNGSREA